MVAVRRPLGLTDDLTRLAASLEALDLRGSGAVAGLAATRDRLVSVIRSYLIPRIENPDEPLLVVVAGPTGSGKSTLVNTLAGLNLSLTGPTRPTTMVPMVLTRAARHEAGMSVGGVECVVRTGLAPILEHMSLIDTPDIDSTSVEHRVVAETLIDHADIVLFVTSALRYADDVPWEVLRRALSRGTTVIPVLNRVGAESGAALLDFRALLSAAGIVEKPVRVPEHHLGPGAQQIPSLAVRDLRHRLYSVAKERGRFHREVVNRVINVTAGQVRDLIDGIIDIGTANEAIAGVIDGDMAAAARLDHRDRPWAALDLGYLPSGRLRAGIWMRRHQPPANGLHHWVGQVRAGLVVEIETRVREEVVDQRTKLALTGPAAPIGLVDEVMPIIGGAVNGWLEAMSSLVGAHPYPRLATMALISATLAHREGPTASAILGEADQDLIDQAVSMFEARMAVVFGHLGARVIELLRLSRGQPAIDDLPSRLSSVLAAYQFADA